MSIVDYDPTDQSCAEEYLEVTDDELQICDATNQPPYWFPYQVEGNGIMMKTPVRDDFVLKPDAISYDYYWLLKQLLGSGKPPPEEEATEKKKGGKHRVTVREMIQNVRSGIKFSLQDLWRKMRNQAKKRRSSSSKGSSPSSEATLASG